MEAVPDGALRDLGLLVLAVPSSSGGSWHPERLMRGLVGLDGAQRASGYARAVRRRRPRRRGRGWDRCGIAASVDRGDNCGRGSLVRAPLHGSSSRLALSGC